jgi:hypothetical protein
MERKRSILSALLRERRWSCRSTLTFLRCPVCICVRPCRINTALGIAAAAGMYIVAFSGKFSGCRVA